MSRIFLRFADEIERYETLIPVDMIWKIEMTYAGKNGDGELYPTVLAAKNSPTALRVYTVFVGNDKFQFRGDEPSDALDVIQKIYLDSIPFAGQPPSTQS